MENKKEFKTLDEAKEYLESKGKKSGYFFYNVYGWSTYLTLKATWCTPSGKHRKVDGKQPFPRRIKVIIDSEGNI
jgi:hypothetical protein